MQLFNELLSASFRGVPFLLDDHTTTGGRKTVTHEFPNSNKRFVEDLGLLNKTFAIRGTITGDNYSQQRDALIQALEREGIGQLSHPFLGVQSVSVKSYTLSERMTALGEAIFNMVFEKSEEPVFPTEVSGQPSTINTEVNAALEDTEQLITQEFKVSFPDNFLDSVSKIEDIFNLLSSITQKFLSDPDFFDTFFSKLLNFFNNRFALADDSTELAKELIALLNSLSDAVTDPVEAKNLFELIYNFGDDQPVLDELTTELEERNKNRAIIDISMQVSALLINFRKLSQIIFQTLNDINLERGKVDAQYNKVIQSDLIKGFDVNLMDAHDSMRKFFEDGAIKAFKLKTIETKIIPLTVLTYQFYGNLDNSDILRDENNVKDVSHIEGDFQVLTK